MKSIWRQYQLSAALDDPNTRSGHDSLADGEELRAFARDIAGVDRHLAAGPPDVAAPRLLHSAIMAKVQQSAEAISGPPGLLMNWWRAPACAAVLIVCALSAAYIARRPAPAAPAGGLEKDLAALPKTVLSPLSDELQSLHHDLENTTVFLLASVP